MTHTAADRPIDFDLEVTELGRSWEFRCDRCGDAKPDGGTTGTELAWSRNLARFGLSGAAEPLLEQRNWGS